MDKIDISKPIALIGNGPSINENWEKFSDIADKAYIARMNFFFLEKEKHFGEKVDFYFWALNNPVLHDSLKNTIKNGEYEIGRYFCPVPAEQLKYTKGMVSDDPFFDLTPSDHWKVLCTDLSIGRFMMSRPFPTTGLQALATLALLGFRKFHLFGLDFYQQNDQRYCYKPPKIITRAMDAVHFRPGYETGAHALETDLKFLALIGKQFPDLEIKNHTAFTSLEDILKNKSTEISAPVFNDISKINDISGSTGGSLSKLEAISGMKGKPDAECESTASEITALQRHVLELATRQKRLAKSIPANFKEKLGVIEGVIKLMSTSGLPYSDTVWLVHETSSLAGVHRPFGAYSEHMRNRFGTPPVLLNFSDPNRRAINAMGDFVTRNPHRVIINSIAVFSDSRVLSYCNKATELFIYMHETAWTIDEYAKKDSIGMDRFKSVVGKATLLCVSPAQQEYFEKNFSPKKTALVFNTVDTIIPASRRKLLPKPQDISEKPNLRIGMVGSFQPRKGTDLFQNTAALLGQLSNRHTFEWIGQRHSGNVRSNVIDFLGPKKPHEVQSFLKQWDIFFIPSKDDPQPLAALEAASLHKRIVCFKDIGTAEWIRDIPGCAVFDEYTAVAAADAIRRASESALDTQRLEEVLSKRFDVPRFCKVLNNALGGPYVSAAAPTETLGNNIFGQSFRKHRALMAIESIISRRAATGWDAAAELVNEIETDPGNIPLYRKLANLLETLGEEARAEDIMLASIQHNPNKPSAKRELGAYYLDHNRYEDAEKFLNQSLKENPNSDRTRILLDKVEKSIIE